jgi:hypothetical protein
MVLRKGNAARPSSISHRSGARALSRSQRDSPSRASVWLGWTPRISISWSQRMLTTPRASMQRSPRSVRHSRRSRSASRTSRPRTRLQLGVPPRRIDFDLARGFQWRGRATRLSCPANSRGCGCVGAVRRGDRDRMVVGHWFAREASRDGMVYRALLDARAVATWKVADSAQRRAYASGGQPTCARKSRIRCD